MTQDDATAHSRGPDDELEDHDLGLSHDLPTLLNRRRALGLLSGAGLAAALAACSGSDGARRRVDHHDAPAPPRRHRRRQPGAAGSEVDVADGEIPEETAGPFPGDGSNGVNVLDRERHRPQRHHQQLRHRVRRGRRRTADHHA